MRVPLKGINPVRKRLADGTVKMFYYAWRGKDAPRLQGEPGTPEFHASYNAAVATKVAPVPGTLRSVLTAYQASSNFAALSEPSRKEYARYIARIDAKFAAFPLSPYPTPARAACSSSGGTSSAPSHLGQPTTPGLFLTPPWPGASTAA
jgi:hypothetical protein